MVLDFKKSKKVKLGYIIVRSKDKSLA